MPYRIIEQWRFADYDGQLRVADDEVAAASEATGDPEHVFAIVKGEGEALNVVADCYSRHDADMVCNALNGRQ